jgi:hypothetical protein
MNLRRYFSRLAGWLVCFVVVFGVASAARACPSCQAALSADGSQGDLARGIYYSILFMMSMPFAIIGTFAGFAYRAVLLERRRLAEAEQARKSDDIS